MLVIQQHIHKPEFAKRLTDMIDSVVTCKLPKSVLDLPDQPNPYPVFASEAYPEDSRVVRDAARIARYLNHKHTFTCWKYKNCAKCRLAYKRQLSLLTYFTEIHRDPSKEECVPVRKLPGSPGNELISEPPPRIRGNPFVGGGDPRCIVKGLARENEMEQKQVERNDLTTSCCRCNSSIQPMITPF